jgi:hypothetical protein
MRQKLFWLSEERWARMPHLPTDVRGVERVDGDCPPECGPPTTIYNRFVR